MFTTRNVVLGVIAVFVISLAWGCYLVSRPPDSHGLGADTYGTRRHGYRALFEILAELGIHVERGLAPPAVPAKPDMTYVFWTPGEGLVAREPSYLHGIGDWMHAGGHVVVAPPNPRNELQMMFELQEPSEHSETLFEALRSPEIDTYRIKLNDIAANHAREQTPERIEPPKKDPLETDDATPERRSARTPDEVKLFRRILAGEKDWQPSRSIVVKCVGSLSHLAQSVSTLEVPEDELQVLDLGSSNPQGRITFVDPAGDEHTLAASFQIDQGELIVVAAQVLGENRLIAEKDNSVLVANLIAGSGRPVIFDEFYHGLTVRGNPLWLFTRQGFGVVTLCLLLAVGMLIWREAIFLGPPLADAFTSRRSIGEYVVAMARFLNRGRAARRFVLEEVRHGVLHSVRQELALPPGRDDVDELANVLRRRNPQRATKLVDAVTQIDQALSVGTAISEKDAIRLLQGISSCL